MSFPNLIADFNSLLRNKNRHGNYTKSVCECRDMSQDNDQYVVYVYSINSRQNEMDANFHQNNFTYEVRIKVDGQSQEAPVCYKAFLPIFSITKGILEHLQKSLKTGIAPSDRRGRSSSHKKLDINTKQLICTHIK